MAGTLDAHKLIKRLAEQALPCTCGGPAFFKDKSHFHDCQSLLRESIVEEFTPLAEAVEREKALRERLEAIIREMENVRPCEHNGACNIAVEGCTFDLRDYADQLRGALGETLR